VGEPLFIVGQLLEKTKSRASSNRNCENDLVA